MGDTPLLASLLKRMNENQLALGAAIEELSSWVEQRGSSEVAQNIRGALDTLDGNAGFIPLALASLVAEVERRSNHSARWQHISDYLVLLYLTGTPRKKWPEGSTVYAHVYA